MGKFIHENLTQANNVYNQRNQRFTWVKHNNNDSIAETIQGKVNRRYHMNDSQAMHTKHTSINNNNVTHNKIHDELLFLEERMGKLKSMIRMK